jgi:hypothetical protein
MGGSENNWGFPRPSVCRMLKAHRIQWRTFTSDRLIRQSRARAGVGRRPGPGCYPLPRWPHHWIPETAEVRDGGGVPKVLVMPKPSRSRLDRPTLRFE